jgi:creatinine amidohydrolase/Fe(II)-dependent formamide hydrolase-like protein
MRGDLFSGTVAMLSQGFHKFTRRGVFGKATLASEQKGRRILDITVRELKSLFEQVWPAAKRKTSSKRRA